jgi:hypothetical protein
MSTDAKMLVPTKLKNFPRNKILILITFNPTDFYYIFNRPVDHLKVDATSNR